MSKLRAFTLFLTIAFVTAGGILFSLYARGFRFDSKNATLVSNGLLVVKSDPEGAQIFVNGTLKTATNTTLSLTPGEYTLTIKKDGYKTWEKVVKIEKEVVTQNDVQLFKEAPSLSSLTFTGAFSPTLSDDASKLAYGVTTPTPKSTKDLGVIAVDPIGTAEDSGKDGLWVIENFNLPLGFSRDPKRITDLPIPSLPKSSPTWVWSPDGGEILLTTADSIHFLLPAGEFTSKTKLTPLTSVKLESTLKDWGLQRERKLTTRLKKLPDELTEILVKNTKDIVFSPDQNKVVYTATASATIPVNLTPQLPGASTQREDREIKPGKSYVYDAEEDRNFLIETNSKLPMRLTWFPTSGNLLLAEPEKVSIVDYDGTNKQTVYSGLYEVPNAFPTLSRERIMILTNLGAKEKPADIYLLSVK